MGEQPARVTTGSTRPLRRRRILVDDARRNGTHLRTTWHAEDRVFVVSTWNNRVCTSAVRVPVEEAGDLAGLLVDGLAEAAGGAPATRSPRKAAPPRRPGKLRRELQVWARFGRSRMRALLGDRRSRRPATGLPTTLTAVSAAQHRRTA